MKPVMETGRKQEMSHMFKVTRAAGCEGVYAKVQVMNVVRRKESDGSIQFGNTALMKPR
jgi:hypothetical protein